MKSIRTLFFIIGFLPAIYGMSNSINTKYPHTDISTSQEELNHRLLIAAESGSLEKLKELIFQGANIDAKESSWDSTPLHEAARFDHVACLKELIAKGADINAKNCSGETPLHIAVWTGSVACLQVLIAQGANIKAPDNHGLTPLYISAMHGQFACLKELLKNNAHINCQTDKGKTPLNLDPLYLAKRNGHEICAQLLLDYGVKTTRNRA